MPLGLGVARSCELFTLSRRPLHRGRPNQGLPYLFRRPLVHGFGAADCFQHRRPADSRGEGETSEGVPANKDSQPQRLSVQYQPPLGGPENHDWIITQREPRDPKS